MKKYVVAIDQGTTSTLITLVNKKAEIIYKDSIEISQQIKDNEILQNPEEIYQSVKILINRLLDRNNLSPKQIVSIGITNQRETTIIWNSKTGKPIYPAISWQSTQTEYITKTWIEKGYQEVVYNKTGLTIHPYFSASKIKHILSNSNEKICDLKFGTIDSYLLYRLTKGKEHKTDITNASRTMLYNIEKDEWDLELLELFDVPREILPQVMNNDCNFGYFEIRGVKIPINAMIGDQQAALFGHQCFFVGETKITYGTGTFVLLNLGNKKYLSNRGLLTTIAWKINNKKTYALEGSVFMGGAAVAWMRDKLNLVNNISETEKLAYASIDTDVYVVPAFAGLGTPYWDYEAKGSILGLKKSTTKADIMKATLNAIAYQATDVLNVMRSSTDIKIKSIAVDGGASNNNYLMQYQSNLVNKKLIQNTESDITALGAAYLAGLKSNFWEDYDTLKNHQYIKQIYTPESNINVENDYKTWKLAVAATRMFKKEKEDKI